MSHIKFDNPALMIQNNMHVLPHLC